MHSWRTSKLDPHGPFCIISVLEPVCWGRLCALANGSLPLCQARDFPENAGQIPPTKLKQSRTRWAMWQFGSTPWQKSDPSTRWLCVSDVDPFGNTNPGSPSPPRSTSQGWQAFRLPRRLCTWSPSCYHIHATVADKENETNERWFQGPVSVNETDPVLANISSLNSGTAKPMSLTVNRAEFLSNSKHDNVAVFWVEYSEIKWHESFHSRNIPSTPIVTPRKYANSILSGCYSKRRIQGQFW